jgi:hypothetical protein
MRKLALAAAAAAFGMTFAAALAQQSDPAKHGATSQPESGAGPSGPMSAPSQDSRQLVDLPPEARDHQMRNMRKHFQAISDILAALGAAEYDKAAGIARVRLGVDSMAAAGCKGAAGGANMSAVPDARQMLARHMPEGMRSLGMAMHRAADAFASAAEAAARSGDPKPAYAALSRVTEGCVNCHKTYRVY